MQQFTWPFAGRYDLATDTIQPFDLAQEVAWPFLVETLPAI